MMRRSVNVLLRYDEILVSERPLEGVVSTTHATAFFPREF
jgi:hypothetical protein